MKPAHDWEDRILEFLEGELDDDEAAALLREAERNPELGALLRRYEEQEAVLKQAFQPHSRRAETLPPPPLTAPIVAINRGHRSRRRILGWSLAAAASIAAVLGTWGFFYASVTGPAPHAILAQVNSSSGLPVQVVHSTGPLDIQAGASVPWKGSVLKTPTGTVATFQASWFGGAGVELNANTTVTLSESKRETALLLERGEMLIWGDGMASDEAVTIRVDDIEVRGKGAVFSVARGLGGAEVTVLEGRVAVLANGLERTVQAGESLSTTNSQPLPASERVAWSGQWRSRRPMLEQLGELWPPVVEAPGTTTGNPKLEELARYLPESTYTFVATDDLEVVLRDAGLKSLSEALTPTAVAQWGGLFGGALESPTISGALEAIERLIAEPQSPAVLDQLQKELVVAVYEDGALLLMGIDGSPAPVDVMTREKVTPILESLDLPNPLRAQVVGRWLVIGTAGEQLDQTVAYIQADQPSRFGNNSFFRSVSRTTRDGTFTVAMDAKAWMDQTRRRNAQVVPGLRQLGFESISAMVASNGFTDQAANRALRLDFQAGREGMFRWMGAPAPLSTPSVMAGNTWFFAGMRTDEPATIVRDLLMLTDAEDSEDTSTTAALESLAASLGNEVGLGIGRPLLPMPRVRLALEVKDGPRFLSSLCVLLQAADADNTMRVQLVRRGGRDVVRFEHPRTSLPIAVGIARDQAVFTFGEAALEEVWRDIEGNNTLANSNHFRHAMPAKSGTHASMVVYHQPSAQGGELQGLLQLIGATTPPLDSTTLQPPAVLYAVADGDRIDLYGDGIRNQWDLGRLVSSGTALMARNGGEE